MDCIALAANTHTQPNCRCTSSRCFPAARRAFPAVAGVERGGVAGRAAACRVGGQSSNSCRCRCTATGSTSRCPPKRGRQPAGCTSRSILDPFCGPDPSDQAAAGPGHRCWCWSIPPRARGPRRSRRRPNVDVPWTDPLRGKGRSRTTSSNEEKRGEPAVLRKKGDLPTRNHARGRTPGQTGRADKKRPTGVNPWA